MKGFTQNPSGKGREMKQPSCKERIGSAYEIAMKMERDLWEMYLMGNDEIHPEHECTFPDHFLWFDYVPAGTFADQNLGYFIYQLSTGGPGDEFRFFASKGQGGRWFVYKVEYWYLDWFDGAKIELCGPEKSLLVEIFDEYFDHVRDQVYDSAMEEGS